MEEINFKNLTFDDIEIIRPRLAFLHNPPCESSLGTVFMWKDYFNIKYTLVADCVVFTWENTEKPKYFSIPIGENSKEALRVLYAYTRKNNLPLCFGTIIQEDLQPLDELFDYEKELVPNWSDYLYLAKDLKELQGSEYGKIRNRIKHFKNENPNWEYVELSGENIDKAIECLKTYSNEKDKTSETFKEDLADNMYLLENLEKFNFLTGALKVGEKIVAFEIAEKINNTLFIHVEKADMNYKGAFQTIVNEFLLHNASDEMLVNREDSAGDSGLAESKRRYTPIAMLEKYFVTVKNIKF